MKIAVSGSSGFIGQHLCKELEKRGHDVYGLVRDYIDEGWQDYDEIYHLAAYGNHYDQTDKKQMFESNVLLTERLLKLSNGAKFYNISSSSVTLKKLSDYAMTKMWAEQITSRYTNTVNIRPYSVYGEGEANHRFIPTVIRHLLSGEEMTLDEEACHDWIHCFDFIEAMLKGYTEIGTGVKTSNRQVVKYLELISGKNLNYKQGKLRDYDNDEWVCQKSVPHRSIYNGLKQAYEYYAQGATKENT